MNLLQPLKLIGLFYLAFVQFSNAEAQYLTQNTQKPNKRDFLIAIESSFTRQDQTSVPKKIGLSRTKVPKSFYRDMGIVIPQDVLNDAGEVVHKAGTKINPLFEMQTQKKMLFINGHDPVQVAWAIQEYRSNPFWVKLILAQGKPRDSVEESRLPWYFDENGTLIRYLGIEHVPARVTQVKSALFIEELVLN